MTNVERMTKDECRVDQPRICIRGFRGLGIGGQPRTYIRGYCGLEMGEFTAHFPFPRGRFLAVQAEREALGAAAGLDELPQRRLSGLKRADIELAVQAGTAAVGDRGRDRTAAGGSSRD